MFMQVVGIAIMRNWRILITHFILLTNRMFMIHVQPLNKSLLIAKTEVSVRSCSLHRIQTLLPVMFVSFLVERVVKFYMTRKLRKTCFYERQAFNNIL
jgi:hypothetical protein